MRKGHRRFFGEVDEAVLGDLWADRGALLAPIGKQCVEPGGVHYGARKDVAADIGGFFHDDDFEIGGFLLERDGGGKARRAGADDHDPGFHNLAFDRVGHRFGIPSEVAGFAPV